MSAQVQGKLETLAPDTLYALGASVPNDGRVSWVRANGRGYIPLNSYLLKEGDHGWLIDTSLPIVEQAVVSQARLLGELTDVELILTRCVEFDSVGNAEPLLHVLPINVAYAAFKPTEWMYFRAPAHAPARAVEPRLLPTNAPLITPHRREIFVLNARLKLLATAWVYDAKSRTLFTSDAFSHVLAWEPGQRIVTTTDDTTSPAIVREHLMTKFDWLLGAETGPLRRHLREIRRRWPIDIVAPGYGCVIVGAQLVERHFEMMDSALEELDHDFVAVS
jgi:flavorubredoxin